MDQQKLSDRIEIADVITRYTRAVDSSSWDGLDTVFTEDAQIDYTESGGIAGGTAEVKKWLAETLPAFFGVWMHTVGQLDVRFDGDDAADVTAYFHNPMTMGEQLVEVGGYYHHRMVRTADGWRSEKLFEEKVWSRGI